MSTYAGYEAGTAKSWINTGGDYTLTLTSLANNAAREGAKGDLFVTGKGIPDFIEWRLESAVGSTATDGLQIELFVGESDSATAGTDNPGNLTGADAGLSNPDELKRQCTRVGALSLSNARTTSVQKQRFRSFPKCRYQIPLIVNKSGQTLSGTAGNHKLVATPYFRISQ